MGVKSSTCALVLLRMSSSRSNSATDHIDEATEAIDSLSIASPSVGSILEGEGSIDVSEAFAKWAVDICKYANKDLDKENGRSDDAVEDIELRLEEFEHLLEMQQRDSTTCLFKQMPQLSQRFEEMERVFDGIDRLELMVARCPHYLHLQDQGGHGQSRQAASGSRIYHRGVWGPEELCPT